MNSIVKRKRERPTVQIGDPFMEKMHGWKLCLELMNNGAVISIQDMSCWTYLFSC